MHNKLTNFHHNSAVKTCPELDINSTELSYSAEALTYNSTAIFSCSDTWKLVGGDRVHVCGQDGEWIGAMPHCIST